MRLSNGQPNKNWVTLYRTLLFLFCNEIIKLNSLLYNHVLHFQEVCNIDACLSPTCVDDSSDSSISVSDSFSVCGGSSDMDEEQFETS